VANVHVYIELAGDRPVEPSLEALGEGRRISSFLGATLYAVLPTGAPPESPKDELIAFLGGHGADKVVVVSAPELGTPPLYASHGHALASVCERIPPALVLLASTPGGRDLAPRLAAKLGAAFLAEPSVEYGPGGELYLSRTVYGGAFKRRLAADDVERPLVVTITPGSYEKAIGEDEAEVLVIQPASSPPAPFEEVSRVVDPGASLATAPVVVTAGCGVEKASWPLLVELARLLGGEVAVTQEAAQQGLGPIDRAVGIGGRTVAPRLYVACGASGSTAHIMAVSPDAEIVAINRDPHAPIFRIAAFGIVGDVADVLPTLLASLKKSGAAGKADRGAP
jgi:electron transfer flavoprotein alpha subunit